MGFQTSSLFLGYSKCFVPHFSFPVPICYPNCIVSELLAWGPAPEPL